MRQADKALAKAQAQLDRAKQRGRRDEIRNAALAIGRAKQVLQRENAKQLAKQAETARAAAERAERLANPKTPQERRSAAAAKGWQTRRERELRSERAKAAENVKVRHRAGSVRIFAVDDGGGIWPTQRNQLDAQEQIAADVIADAFGAGSKVFGTYTVAENEDDARYWVGVVVWIDDFGNPQYRYTPRGLSLDEVIDNVEALTLDYGRKNQVCAAVPLL